MEADETPAGARNHKGGPQFVAETEGFEDLPPPIAGAEVATSRSEKALGMNGSAGQLGPLVEVVELELILDKTRRR